MAANLFGERFLGFREPAWHSLGKTFDQPITAVEAVRQGGLEYTIEKYPLFAEGGYPTGKFGIFREPTMDDMQYRFLGVCGEEYNIVQNTMIAEILDPLTKMWPVETVGALGVGETMFLSLDAGDAEVHGEHIKQFFLITDTRDGGTSMRIAFTPIRVVCQNTLVSGLKQATVSAALQHGFNIEQTLRTRVTLLEKMQKARVATMATFEALASAAIQDDDAQTIFTLAYPNPKRTDKLELLEDFDSVNGPEMLGALYDEATRAEQSWLYYTKRAETMREGVRSTYDRLCDEHPGIASTAWAAYNAVVEFADFREGSNVAKSALFGSRSAEKKRAFAAALAYVTK